MFNRYLHNRNNNRNFEYCQICMSYIKPTDNKLSLNCTHSFHYGCFVTMNQMDDEFSLNSCVICKKNLGVQYFNFESDVQMTSYEEKCPICLEKLGFEKDVKSTECDHMFHTKCINKWLKRSPTCPMCRTINENERYRRYNTLSSDDEDTVEISVTNVQDQLSMGITGGELVISNLSSVGITVPQRNTVTSLTSLLEDFESVLNRRSARMEEPRPEFFSPAFFLRGSVPTDLAQSSMVITGVSSPIITDIDVDFGITGLD